MRAFHLIRRKWETPTPIIYQGNKKCGYETNKWKMLMKIYDYAEDGEYSPTTDD